MPAAAMPTLSLKLWKVIVYKNNPKKSQIFHAVLMLSLKTSPSTHLLQLMAKINFYHNLTSRSAFTAVLWELSGIAENLTELKELHLNMRKTPSVD